MNRVTSEILKERTKSLTEFIGRCRAERLYYGIEPNGDIAPCVFIPIKLGNIQWQSLVKIWRELTVLKQIRNRDAFKGCRARAYAYFNDLQGPDPSYSINQKYYEK